MYASVLGQFGMERGYQITPLLDQYRVALIIRQNSHSVVHVTDNRSPNEDRLHFAGSCAIFEVWKRLELHDAAIDLPAVGVALDRNVYEA